MITEKVLGFQKKDYYMFLGAKGDVIDSSVKEVISHIGEADILIPYVGNPEVRSLFRRVISRAFTILLNILFGLKLKYYNGIIIHKTKLLKNIKMNTNNGACYAEALIRMLRKGHSYKQIPFYVRKTDGHNTLRIKNLIGVFLTISRLFFENLVYRLDFKRRTAKYILENEAYCKKHILEKNQTINKINQGGKPKMPMKYFEYENKDKEKARAVDVLSLLETMSELEEYKGVTNEKILDNWYALKQELLNTLSVELPKPAEEPEQENKKKKEQ